MSDDVGLDHFEVRRVHCALMAEAFDLFDQGRRGYAGDRVFTRRGDVENQDIIGQVEWAGELIRQMEGAGITLGLEYCKDSSEIRSFRGSERCSNFGWVASVIIDDSDAGRRLDRKSPDAALQA